MILIAACEKGSQNSRRVTILYMDRDVLLLSYGSCCSLPWMMLRAGSLEPMSIRPSHLRRTDILPVEVGWTLSAP